MSADIQVFRTVAKFTEQLAECGRLERKLVLGLDPGTNCGYAFGFIDAKGKLQVEPGYCGIWNLSVGKYDSGALRFLRLRYFLQEAQPDFVCIEGSPFTMGSIVARGKGRGGAGQKSLGVGMDAQAFLAAIRATVACWCEERGIPCHTVEVSDVKRRATGKGNANKLDIIRAANKEFGLSLPVEENSGADNVADAVFIRCIAAEQCAAGLISAKKGVDSACQLSTTPAKLKKKKLLSESEKL